MELFVLILQVLEQLADILQLPIDEAALHDDPEGVLNGVVRVTLLSFLGVGGDTLCIIHSTSSHWLFLLKADISILLFWYLVGSSLVSAFFRLFIIKL